jgi:hypothetical protein
MSSIVEFFIARDDTVSYSTPLNRHRTSPQYLNRTWSSRAPEKSQSVSHAVRAGSRVKRCMLMRMVRWLVPCGLDVRDQVTHQRPGRRIGWDGAAINRHPNLTSLGRRPLRVRLPP